MEEKIDEFQANGYQAFMVSGFHPRQMDEIIRKLEHSPLFEQYGLVINKESISSPTFIHGFDFFGRKEMFKALIWAFIDTDNPNSMTLLLQIPSLFL